MTATDELRAMLDERDVEWAPSAIPLSDVTATFWIDCNGNVCSAVGGTSDLSYSMLSVQANFTPAQAIAATLGDNDATQTRQDDATKSIAATVTKDSFIHESGMNEQTCTVESMHGFTDAHVSTRYFVELSCHTIDDWGDSEPPKFCPYCGRKVVSE